MKIQIQTEKQHEESHVSTRSYSVLHEVSLMWLLLNLCYLTPDVCSEFLIKPSKSRQNVVNISLFYSGAIVEYPSIF